MRIRTFHYGMVEIYKFVGNEFALELDVTEMTVEETARVVLEAFDGVLRS